MDYRSLGRTKLTVSEIGLGCEGLMKKSTAEVKEFVNLAFSQGINFIDLYSPNPDLRSNFGAAIKGNREKWVVQGHISAVWKDNQYLRARKMKEVRKGFDDLLTRLETDYIDVGMIHYVDSQKDYEMIFGGEIIEYAKVLKTEGKVRFIGISSHNPQVAMQAVQTGLIDVLLFSINPCYDMLPASEDVEELWNDDNYESPLTNIDPQRAALYQYCHKEGVAITVMKAFGGGDLLDAKLSPFKVALTSQQCIHYCLTRPGVASVMSGAHTAEELMQDISYCTASKEEKDYSVVLAKVEKHSFVGNCVYCGHCAPCTQYIDIASVNKFLDLCLAQGEVVETVREHYAALEHHGSDCIGCGQCMSNCPFAVDIIAKMQKATEIFGY